MTSLRAAMHSNRIKKQNEKSFFFGTPNEDYVPSEGDKIAAFSAKQKADLAKESAAKSLIEAKQGAQRDSFRGGGTAEQVVQSGAQVAAAAKMAQAAKAAKVAGTAGKAAQAGKLAGSGGNIAAMAGMEGLKAMGVGDNPESTAGIGMSAASGAMTGSMIAPGVGTAVGAVVGGTIGLLKARSARKKRAREAAAKAHANIGVIRQQEQRDISSALDNIRQGFQSSLIRNTPQVRF